MDCDIIIPVGPGHEEIVNRAIDSVRIASLDKGMFSRVGVKVVDDTKGEMGRAAARNKGVAEVEGDVLFFLDADDCIHPEAFKTYSDGPVRDAVWGNIYEMVQGLAMWRYQVPRIRNYQELLAFEPYMTLQMGHFVKREVAEANRFNEDMDTGEDWDYYLRVWKNHSCIKIREPLMLNYRGQHSAGPRSATGVEWSHKVRELIEEARAA